MTKGIVINKRIKLTREELQALVRGEKVIKKTGTNIMSESLCTEISIKQTK